jgi:hypothetical protein
MKRKKILISVQKYFVRRFFIAAQHFEIHLPNVTSSWEQFRHFRTNFVKNFRIFRGRESLKNHQQDTWPQISPPRRIKKPIF